MRVSAYALSAVLISGCSWFGGNKTQNSQYNQSQSYHSGYGSVHHNTASSPQPCYGQHNYYNAPAGCETQSVRAAQPPNNNSQQGQSGEYDYYQQFNQPYIYDQPDYAQQGQYTTHRYGSHVGGQNRHYQKPRQRVKPRPWRGNLSFGTEKSISGTVFDYNGSALGAALTGYNPTVFTQSQMTGTPLGGITTNTVWTADDADRYVTTELYDEAVFSNISYDDAQKTPITIAGGLEYAVTPNASIFANAGYFSAEGGSGSIAQYTGTLYRDVETQTYDAFGVPNAPVTNVTDFIPDQNLGGFNYDFTDSERIDLELGGRYYLRSPENAKRVNSVTPFIGASAGLSHYKGVDVDIEQTQRDYAATFDGLPQEYLPSLTSTLEVYDGQWLASGQLNAGLEWQATSKTALALETGVRFEQAREYSDGTKGDENIAIPLKIRGSYNF